MNSQAATLEHHMAPGTLHKKIAVGSRVNVQHDYVPWGVNYQDLKPPGVRSNIPDPAYPDFGANPAVNYLRTNGNTRNVNPVPNFYGGMVPSWMMSPWAQRANSYWWETLMANQTEEHYLFRDYGQFSVPYTGFTAFDDLSIGSTRSFL